MDIWLTFAYILDGEIKNIGSFLYTGYTQANECAKSFCKDADAFAVDVTHIPVQIGDNYTDGKFYRIIDGNIEIINPIPSMKQQIDTNTSTIDVINAQTYYTAIMTDTLIDEEM